MGTQKNVFDKINNYIEDAEGSIITLVTTMIPWLAPLLPAYLTMTHLINDLKIPATVAWAMAASVEFLGLAAVATAFDAMRHNKQKDNRAKENKVSLTFPVGSYVFYLLIVLVVNVVLGIPMQEENKVYAHLIATGLLTLISAPAFIIAVTRHQRHTIRANAKDEGTSKSANVRSASADAPVRNAQRTAHRDSTKLYFEDFEKDQLARNGLGMMSAGEIQEKYGRKRRAAYDWINKFKDLHPDYETHKEVSE